MKRIKLLFFVILLTITFTGCRSGKENILSKSKKIIDADLDTDSNIGKCYYNEDINVSYVKFFSMIGGEDDAVIMLDANTIYYGSVFSQIEDDDYDKIIEYGDYALYSYQVISGDEDWTEIKVE